MEPPSDNLWLENVVIRHLIAKDLPELEWGGEYAHLRNVYLNAYKNRNQGLNVLWVAEINPIGIIGQIFVQLNSIRKELSDGFFSAYIFSFRIKPEFRNRGLGTAMISHVQTDLRKRKFREMTLNVAKTNEKAIRFYQRLGFTITNEERGEWSFINHENKRQYVSEPAWRMVKPID